MIEIYFLIALSAIWLAFAGIYDLKTKTVPDWICLSLAVFAMGYRFFHSIFSGQGFGIFYQGLFGLAIFFALGNLLYYGRMFAGGDAKLMVALGAILPLSTSFKANLEIYATYFFIFLVTGAAYGLAWSAFFSASNFQKFKKEFKRRIHMERRIVWSSTILAIIFLGLGFFYSVSFYLAMLLLIFPWLYVYAKAIDESCLVKEVSPKKLEEGDWIYKDIRVGSRTIRANWHGLTKNEIREIRKRRGKIMIREGIAFSPVFFISLVIFSYVYLFGFQAVENFLGRLL